MNGSALYLGIAAGTALGGLLLPVSVPVALGASAALALLSLLYLTATHRAGTNEPPSGPAPEAVRP
ncbi:hypothetical protein [Nonomuraea jiangxiensis]|uniref:hypothetical protein n=1 Tax=Nonomuraea jiangxiensis TaxID=633440 RepID=UPI00115F92B3|nr:hypothetical protein [Nonomuraea jiangxiensis]